MLYLSQILIFAGVCLIIYALINNSKKISSARNTYNKHGEKLLVKESVLENQTLEIDDNLVEFDKVAIEEEEDSVYEADTATNEIPFDSEESFLKSKTLQKIEDNDSQHNSEMIFNIIDKENDNIDTINISNTDSDIDSDQDIRYAILFEDSSNLFDYDNQKFIVDSTMIEYNKIKGIGKGILEVNRDGINFNIEKEYFRFDFHRIEEVKSGSNFFSLFLRGSDIARLFLFEKDDPFGIEIKQIYNNYSLNI